MITGHYARYVPCSDIDEVVDSKLFEIEQLKWRNEQLKRQLCHIKDSVCDKLQELGYVWLDEWVLRSEVETLNN